MQYKVHLAEYPELLFMQDRREISSSIPVFKSVVGSKDTSSKHVVQQYYLTRVIARFIVGLLIKSHVLIVRGAGGQQAL